MPVESAYTSQNQVPAAMKSQNLTGTNLDYGGGKYDAGTDYLKTQGVRNLVYDPFNRSQEHNDGILAEVKERGIDSITLLNVLNVIQDNDELFRMLEDVKKIAEDNVHRFSKLPRIIIQIYEGDKSGNPSKTTTQRNQWCVDYSYFLDSVFKFNKNSEKGNIINLTGWRVEFKHTWYGEDTNKPSWSRGRSQSRHLKVNITTKSYKGILMTLGFGLYGGYIIAECVTDGGLERHIDQWIYPPDALEKVGLLEDYYGNQSKGEGHNEKTK